MAYIPATGDDVTDACVPQYILDTRAATCFRLARAAAPVAEQGPDH